ncbi:MAG TPA: hypothetical protein DCL61_26180 [Cyanobacteria bacterium UBA12227]|nr:hypothetical protein [Cyanobacteria bacterium UBA12227]HAX86282.1 hypothetical protein [Cyanobacteria bacterium UBA11370]HBY81200.1 hypothetical protein [Cyanobacteria bacterium UBA11148]
MRIPYYAIYEVTRGVLEVYNLVGTRYQKMTLNERGHYLIRLNQ